MKRHNAMTGAAITGALAMLFLGFALAVEVGMALMFPVLLLMLAWMFFCHGLGGPQ